MMGANRVPRVSVVVPMYNSGPYLTEAIESVLAQTYRDWEAVLVDDASTDDTYEVAASFAEREPARVTALRLERNVGVAAARNAAIEASRGSELIALLDHDDYWRGDYLEQSVALYDAGVAAGKKIGIVACNAKIHTPDGLAEDTFADRFGWPAAIDYDSMIERNCIFARALFAKGAYREVGGFSSECPGYDDYDLWLRIMEAGYEVVATREPIAVYRHHPGNMSHDPLLMAAGAIAAHGRALQRGALTTHQRRAVRSRMRHNRALRERALVREAITQRRPLAAAVRFVRAAPYGLIALLQKPSRWREWGCGLLPRREGAGSSHGSRP